MPHLHVFVDRKPYKPTKEQIVHLVGHRPTFETFNSKLGMTQLIFLINSQNDILRILDRLFHAKVFYEVNMS